MDAEHFVSYYQANGWKVGRNLMRDWKAAVRTWDRRERPASPPPEENCGYVLAPQEDPFEIAMRERGYF